MLDQKRNATSATTWQDNQSGRRGHKLMTKDIPDTIPPLYANDGVDDPDAVVAKVKLFSSYNGWRWYITSGTPRPDCASASSKGSRPSLATLT